MITNIRKAMFAGGFYSSNQEELEDEVLGYLSKKKENIKLAISPHAGFMFSGKLAGDTLGKFENKKDFIILGVNHSGLGMVLQDLIANSLHHVGFANADPAIDKQRII